MYIQNTVYSRSLSFTSTHTHTRILNIYSLTLWPHTPTHTNTHTHTQQHTCIVSYLDCGMIWRFKMGRQWLSSLHPFPLSFILSNCVRDSRLNKHILNNQTIKEIANLMKFFFFLNYISAQSFWNWIKISYNFNQMVRIPSLYHNYCMIICL